MDLDSLRCRTSVAVTVAVLSCCGAGAFDAEVRIKLPNGIAYELAPIAIEVAVKQAAANATYHVYDFYKNELASGPLESGTTAFSFTPPRWGWYMVSCVAGGRGVGEFFGVTPSFEGLPTLAQGDMKGGWNDAALVAFAGLGLDRTNTRHKGIEGIAETLARSEKFGVPLLVQFEGKEHCSSEHVRRAVTMYKGRVKYWEIMNEPNFGMGPDAYAAMVKRLVPMIKGIDPRAIVMGPDTCGVDLGWYDAVYRAGAGKLLDAISIHDYEGDEAIDPFHWIWKMGELRKIMERHGDGAKPIWQTERAIGGVRGKAFLGATQGLRITLQRDLLELFGVTNDHNSHYYANVTGYNDVPTFVFSESGPYPAALLCRTRAAMIAGRRFVERLDFGPSGNNIMLGLLYEGAKGSTATLRNLGTRNLLVEFGVRGGRTLEVVDSFGNVEKVAVRRGKARVTVSQAPVYVRLTKGQKLAPPRIDFGKNIARDATFTYSSATKSNQAVLTDGIFQVWHNANPWGAAWFGSYPGKVFNAAPQTLDMKFDGAREIGGFAVYGARADNPHCALLDYDLQYRDGDAWKTIEEVRAHCPESVSARTYICETVTWYLDSNCFVHRFAEPVRTDALRLVVRRITRGFPADMAAERAMGWKASNEQLELREVEIYEVSPPSGLIASGVPLRAATVKSERAPAGRDERAAKKVETAAFDAKLVERLAERTRAGGRPSFFMKRMRTRMAVVSVRASGVLTVKATRSGIELSLAPSRLTVEERRDLAVSLAKSGDARDHALAAFYSLCANKPRDARGHLRAAGEHAADVRAAFPGE